MSTKGGKRQARSKEKLHAVMVYLPEDLTIKLAKYAEDWRMSKSILLREGLETRILGYKEDPFSAGFNRGLEAAIDVIKEQSLMKMQYPSGTPVWKHIEELLQNVRRTKGEQSAG